MRNVSSTLIYQWFDEVWNKEDKNAIDRLLSDESLVHGLSPEGVQKGVEGFKAFYDNFKSQFHNIKVEVDDVVSQDNMESARTTVSATNTATNTNVEFTGICMVRTDNGKIAEAWNNYDFLAMYQQLGQTLT